MQDINLDFLDSDRLNQIRDKQLKLITKKNTEKKVLVIIGFISIFALIYLLSGNFLFPAILFVVFGLLFWFLDFFNLFVSYLNKKYTLNYRSLFNEEITKPLINQLGLNLSYKFNINDGIYSEPAKDFKKSKLFLKYNVCFIEDTFEGEMNSIKYKFQEVQLSLNSKYSHILIFDGLYFSFDFSLDRSFVLDVLNDETGDVDMLQKLNFFRAELIKIEDDDFEKNYVVYSNNIDLSKQFLSINFVRKLKLLNFKLGNNIFFSIRNGILHVCFNDENSYFDITEEDWSKQAKRHYADLIKLTSICKEIFNFFKNEIESLK